MVIKKNHLLGTGPLLPLCIWFWTAPWIPMPLKAQVSQISISRQFSSRHYFKIHVCNSALTLTPPYPIHRQTLLAPLPKHTIIQSFLILFASRLSSLTRSRAVASTLLHLPSTLQRRDHFTTPLFKTLNGFSYRLNVCVSPPQNACVET